jgi:hypothetical protein
VLSSRLILCFPMDLRAETEGRLDVHRDFDSRQFVADLTDL